jgi:thiosulfate/3-mercaptopyruvate sulfurtransferase
MAAAQAPFPSLVSAAWLMDHLADVKVLDATWYMPNVTTKDAVEEFRTSRLRGAQFFNLDGVCDWDTDLPHMLPTEAQFAAAADALGISNDDAVVIYDRTGLFSAPRAWWTWHVFGHDKVAVLDGGLPAWTAAGGDLDSTEVEEEDIHKATAAAQSVTPTTQTTYRAKLRSNEVRTRADMVLNIQRQDEQVVDARPAARWRGKAPEPRPGLEMGHIPGSFNVPWDSMLRDGRMLPPKELAKLFKKAGVEVDVEGRPLVFTCGSGTTAAILGLAARQLNPPREFAIYDGSWSEWGKPELKLPVATAAKPDD